MIKTLDLVPVLPEIFMAVAGLALLMLGVFRKEDSTKSVSVLVILALGAAMVLVSSLGGERLTAFNGLFVADRFAGFAKGLVLVASAIATAMSLPYLEREKIGRFEYPVLVLFATLGMMMMISANDFIALYLGLELQSLALYVLAAYNRDNARATEAGLKYFVLGSLASGLLLYGISLLYGFAGTTSFEGLANLFAGGHDHPIKPNMGIIAGLVFVLAGLSFKVSAVPFHMWAPDVYEGAPTPVTSFFAVAPKIAALCLLVRVMTGPFADLVEQWRQVVTFIAIGSMFVGSFAAVVQTNIKRLMAYSSIGHVGFVLVGIAAGSTLGIQGVLIYLAIYLFMNVGAFAVILSMRQKGRMVEGIDDLAGLSKTHPMMAFVMAVLMFSMAGVPPLAGFWGKFYVFMAAIESGLYTLSILGVLSSVVSTYYYLRIVKVMYFDEPVEAFDKPVGTSMTLVMAVSTIVILAFTLIPAPLVTSAKAAAQVLFPAAG
ncbi:NADH:ubiquinone oxidoreductase subunit 2 [Paramagnetospirillum magneticum AMB-1]|uniref:NADH-quinone oxidoreductase subunit N n=2 Tax=Paramagnetospirillum magneticum TaxID=84159 RepID=NUON_PARM1|nr:NADH-quinone oxidoreductase subunit NuoN [Paramagnetospirillum magneticum]Q2W3J7.1 RecName: Full=NADH-quinone oxidoreductase subunit N; AltName: Full=NADH dehydrogenase I subunit N; AltName: Full=NDH-1 subunit N [Paramagnetospirillum magneticum AMB-1]BAE51578.1 NADH:ubiquinone oxidoreductase subunit 2 [Paramagnetospirillum magneticum AMB-1]